MKVGKSVAYPDQPVCRCGAPLVVGQAVAHRPDCPEAAARRRKETEVAALVVSADTTPEAWEHLGLRQKSQAERARDARAQALADHLRERWVRIQTGRKMVEAGHPLTPVVYARFEELHLQRLTFRFKLDACVFRFPSEEAKARRRAELCDLEVNDVLGSLWPSAELQVLMHALNAAVGDNEELCRDAVRVACAQRYATRDNTAQEAS